MNKLILTFVTLIFSSAIYAYSWDSKGKSVNLNAGIGHSKEEAYKLGNDLASNMKSESPVKLKRTLGIYEYGLKTNSIKVDRSQVEISEFSTAQGEVKYRAVVNVNYSYDVNKPRSR